MAPFNFASGACFYSGSVCAHSGPVWDKKGVGVCRSIQKKIQKP